MEQSESTAANPVRPSRKATRRRWLQFSIRTLLVVVTLLCVALSLWVLQAERRRRAVAAIEALQGEYYGYVDGTGTSDSSPVASLRRWLPKAYFHEANIIVVLNGTKITDDGLAYLQVLTGLQELYLDDTQVTDAGLAHLEGLTSLQFLSVSDTKVTNAGLAKLRKALPNCQTSGP